MSARSSPEVPFRNRVAERFREIFDKRTAEELLILAHAKRFLERYRADPRFRGALNESSTSAERIMAAHGIELDPQQVLPLYDDGRTRLMDASVDRERWPVARAWHDYMAEIDECRSLACQAGDCMERRPRFHRWRHRQMRRTHTELGLPAATLVHPILAFELSAGCTIGCWFCGLSAQRFHGFFPYTDANAKLWRDILEQTVDLFGSAAQAGLCYWATDPSDNPDYPRFLEDYYLVTGNLPKTTTAAPLRDLALTRRLMRLADEYPCSLNRFSILSLKTFNEVHEAFSATELMRVDLVLQNRDSLVPKKPVGHARNQWKKLGASVDPVVSPMLAANRSTLVSLSGFLVNLVDRTIQLITPTRTSERWLGGCRVFGKRSFQSAREFREGIDDLIATHMPEEVQGDDILGFRDDLSYRRTEAGFELVALNARYAFSGFKGAAEAGELIHGGDKTATTIQHALAGAGVDPLTTIGLLHRLFEGGLLNEDPGAGGIGAGAPSG